MIPPFDRYPLEGYRHPERPWWVAELGAPFLMGTPQQPYSRLGYWRRIHDGFTVESDRGYNALPLPDDGIVRMREHDATVPVPTPPLRCKQVWRLDGVEVTISHIGRDETIYYVKGMRVHAADPASFGVAVLLDGPFAPWASLAWITQNCPDKGPVWSNPDA